MKTQTRLLVPVAVVIGLGVAVAQAVANDYTDEIEAWRVDRETRLRADDGWLTPLESPLTSSIPASVAPVAG